MNAADSPVDLPVALTIAGSDSGGGAGIQADLQTFAALRVFGTTAITCITAQNPKEVTAIAAVDPAIVTRQIKAVCEAFPVNAAKTGMLYSAEIIRAVAAADVGQGIPVLVVDPVMTAASGALLLQEDAVDALCTELLPQARVITPNLHEAEILWGRKITSVDELRDAASEIGDRFDVACVVKGGHLIGPEIVDVLYDEGEEFMYPGPRIDAAETHGAGCTFSAALTACLARGDLLSDAVSKARDFVRNAIAGAVMAGPHRPLNFFWDHGHQVR